MLLPMPRIAKKTGAYHHGDLRRVLLETAVRVVEKEGVAALSLHALSRKAGVSSGAPYHHFESREQLLAAIAVQGFELMVEEMHRSTAGAGEDAGAYLTGLGRGYIRFALAHRGHFRVMFRPELRAHLEVPLSETLRDAFTLLEEAIDRCQKAGVAPAGDPRPLILLAWSTVHGASALWIDGSLGDEHMVPDGEALAAMVPGTLVALLAAGGRARPGP
jgi:AcrR family transcriptional regulator